MLSKIQPIRIVYIDATAEMGGAEHLLLRLLQGLAANGRYELLLVCPEPGPFIEAVKMLGIRTRIIPLPRFRPMSSTLFSKKLPDPLAIVLNLGGFFRAALRLFRALRGTDIDIIQTNAAYAHLYGGIAARLLRVPCVWYYHDLVEADRLHGFTRRVWKWLGKHLANHVVGISQIVVENLDLPDRACVIYAGYSPSPQAEAETPLALRAYLGLSPDAILAGFVGRIAHAKGLDVLAEALPAIVQDNPHVHILVIGDALFGETGPKARIQASLDQSGTSGNWHWLGYTDEIQRYLAALDFVVMPSRREGLGLALVEAGFASKAAVASSIGGIPEVILHEETGLLVAPENSRALAQAVLRLADNPDLREAMGTKARQYVQQKFGLVRYHAEFMAFYEAILDPKKILFVHNGMSRFVAIDRDLLQERWILQEWHQRGRRVDLPRLAAAVRQADLVFGWFASWHTFWPVMLARFLHKPSVLVIGGYDLANLPDIRYGHQRGGFRKLISQQTIKAASVLMTNSYYSQQEFSLQLGLPASLVTPIYHGIPDSFSAEVVKRSRQPALALTVGGVGSDTLHRKGHAIFVKAAAFLPEIEFVLAGRWQSQPVVDYLKTLATENVTLTDWLSDEALTAYYQQAAVYVQPSMHEGFGMTVAESMLAGCIPVVTRTGALPEVVGDAGVYAASHSPEDVADAVREALGWPDEARQQSRERILTEFSISRRREGLQKLVERAFEAG